MALLTLLCFERITVGALCDYRGKYLLPLLLTGQVHVVLASKLPLSSSQGKGTLTTWSFFTGCFTQMMKEQASCSLLLFKLLASAHSHICMGDAL